jgi:hypothetical protein
MSVMVCVRLVVGVEAPLLILFVRLLVAALQWCAVTVRLHQAWALQCGGLRTPTRGNH